MRGRNNLRLEGDCYKGILRLRKSGFITAKVNPNDLRKKRVASESNLRFIKRLVIFSERTYYDFIKA